MQNNRSFRRAVVAGLLITAIALLLGSCSVPALVFSTQSSSGATPISLGEGDSGHTVKLASGQRLIVQLPANATTGFSWAVAESGGLTQLVEPAYAVTSTSGAVGADGVATLSFEAATAGTGNLRLEYRRPWEKSAPAEKTWSVTVIVE